MEATGAAQVAGESQAVERLEQSLPEPPHSPAVQLVSVDGAMVPLVGGNGLDRADGPRLGLGPDPADPPNQGMP